MDRSIYIDGKYLNNNPTWDIEDSPWKAAKILSIINKHNLQPNSICEVGCGAGEVINQLYLKMPKQISFTGYDISPQAIELCQFKLNDRLQYRLQDIAEVENESFDLLLAIDLIEHIEDYLGFLKMLRKKAVFKIFHIPLDLSVSSILRVNPLLAARKKVGHIHYFTKELAISALTDTGYEVIDFYYTAGSIELPAKSFKTLLAKLPRSIMHNINKDFGARVFGGYSLMVLAK